MICGKNSRKCLAKAIDLVFFRLRELLNTNQGQEIVSVYFTKLKVLWEELSNYNAHCTCGKCIYGGAKDVEHTMSFLMGLNDSYSHIRGQILLMDQIPPVNKIFSLVIQEECQRDVGSNSSNSAMAFNVRSNANHNPRNSTGNQNQTQNYKNYKRSQPLVCTHYNKTGHIKKMLSTSWLSSGISRNFTESRTNSLSTTDSQDVVTGLTQDQCEQIITLVSRKLASASANAVTMTTSPYSSSSDSHSSLYQIQTMSNGLFTSNVWILDSGATQHICNDRRLFLNVQTVKHISVKLPNHMLIQVKLMDSIQLTKEILLTNVLFVPQFELNLVSASSLTKDQTRMVELYFIML